MKTIRDVARIAGVSVASVSRCINTPGRVSEETRAKVQAAIEQCGYRLNYNAKILSTKRTHCIGLVIPTITNPVFADSTRGVQDEASARGFQVLIANADYDPGKERKLVHHLLERQVESLVLTLSSPGVFADELSTMKTPSTFVFSTPSGNPVSCVGIDNERGGFDATAHLADLGHRRIAMFAGNFFRSDRSRQRHAGYLRCLRERGLEADPSLVVEVPFGLLDCRGEVAAMMATDDPPTAIFASTDLTAIAVVNALRGLGYSVPGDVSIVGFDDIAMASYVTPTLTTIRQPAYEMGRLAAKTVLDALGREDRSPRHITLEHELMARESTSGRV